MFGFSIFQIAVAVGKDLQTVLLCRFFGGVFGSCPLAVVAAIFSDVSESLTHVCLRDFQSLYRCSVIERGVSQSLFFP